MSFGLRFASVTPSFSEFSSGNMLTLEPEDMQVYVAVAVEVAHYKKRVFHSARLTSSPQDRPTKTLYHGQREARLRRKHRFPDTTNGTAMGLPWDCRHWVSFGTTKTDGWPHSEGVPVPTLSFSRFPSETESGGSGGSTGLLLSISQGMTELFLNLDVDKSGKLTCASARWRQETGGESVGLGFRVTWFR